MLLMGDTKWQILSVVVTHRSEPKNTSPDVQLSQEKIISPSSRGSCSWRIARHCGRAARRRRC
jgi:hypothetical protein